MGVYYQKKEFLFKKKSDKYFVINQEKGTLINLNETSFFLWKNLDKRLETQELAKLLMSEYDVEPTQAESDIKEFLKTAAKSGIIEKVK